MNPKQIISRTAFTIKTKIYNSPTVGTKGSTRHSSTSSFTTVGVQSPDPEPNPDPSSEPHPLPEPPRTPPRASSSSVGGLGAGSVDDVEARGFKIWREGGRERGRE